MKRAPLAKAVLAALLLLCSGQARGQGRELTLEHDGSLGFFATLGVEYNSVVVADCFFCTGSSVGPDGSIRRAKTIESANAIVDVGGTLAVGQSGSEFLLRGRFAFLSPSKGFAVFLGYRKYWGKDEVKTFIAFDLMANFQATTTFGLRPGFGVAWDFSPIMGLWAEAGGTFGMGWGRRFGAELTVGFQARSYLLE